MLSRFREQLMVEMLYGGNGEWAQEGEPKAQASRGDGVDTPLTSVGT